MHRVEEPSRPLVIAVVMIVQSRLHSVSGRRALVRGREEGEVEKSVCVCGGRSDVEDGENARKKRAPDDCAVWFRLHVFRDEDDATR